MVDRQLAAGAGGVAAGGVGEERPEESQDCFLLSHFQEKYRFLNQRNKCDLKCEES